MIRRITVENFMAHKSTSLELAEGVTVITGPNNTGKSALVEAVRAISQNPPQGRSAIRHGEKNAVVRIELDSGEIVEWVRTGKSSIYKIYQPAADAAHGDDGASASEPEVYAKFGKTPPDDVKALLRLDTVETEAGPVDIHIGNQRYPIFLIDQSGSQAAGFFAASTEAVYLLRMQQALKQRTDRTRARKKELQKECAEIEAELSRFEPLDSIAPVLQQAEELFEAIGVGRRLLPVMGDFIDGLSAMREKCSRTASRSEALNTLAPPPGLSETAPLESLVCELERIGESLICCRAGHDCLAGLSRPPLLLEVQGLDVLVRSIEAASGLFGKVASRLDILSEIASAPQLFNTAALDDLANRIDAASQRSEALRLRSSALAALAGPPQLREAEELAGLTARLARTTSSLDGCVLRTEALERLERPPALFDVKPLEDLIAGLETRRVYATVALGRGEALARLEPPPEIEDAGALEVLVGSLRRLETQTRCTDACREVLGGLAPLPDLFSNRDIEDLIAQVSSLGEKLEKADKLRRKVEDGLLAKRREVEQVIGEAGACPLCGLTMDVAHFLEETKHA